MERKTIIFTDTLPKNEVILAALSTTIPNYKSRISYNNILYAKKKYIQAVVDIYRKETPHKIVVEIDIAKNDLKIILMGVTISALLAYLSFDWIDNTWLRALMFLLPYHILAALIAHSTKIERADLVERLAVFFVSEFGGVIEEKEK